MVPKLLFLLTMLCFSLALTTCGTSQNTSPIAPSTTNTPVPSLAELTGLLEAELSRLGKDPSKTVAVAPSGSNNAVFDLSATIVDGSGIELAWTERIIGDYDQNGEVNLADLAPLALNWQATVDYDDPALHGGFANWPTGDPDGAGADSWRMARVDGDSNGEVSNSDITSIAIHFQERIDGYRVYRKAPGEAGFTMLPPPVPITENVTLAHPANPGNAPVRYSLNDSEATPGGLGDGVYQYYVASFDKTSGAESPASGIVHVDITAGTVNQSPVAQLSITPGFAGAPAEITLDASGSYDPDGTVAAYEWDFDADGVVDWLSTDPVPEESSSGDVNEISVVSPGIVKATYNQGFAEWFYPTVAAVDDEAAISQPANAKLGLSGWTMEVLNPSIEDTKITVWPELISIDPVSGEIVLVAEMTLSELGEQVQGLFFVRETESGPWELEALPTPFLVDGGQNNMNLVDIVWDENNLPIILFNHNFRGSDGAVWSARLLANGTWEVEPRFEGSIPGEVKSVGVSPPNPVFPGKFACYLAEQLTDKQDVYGTGWHNRIHILFYDHGEWSIEFTGIDGADTYNQISLAIGNSNENLNCFYRVIGDMLGGAWMGTWEEGLGFVDPVRFDDGLVSFGSPHTTCKDALLATDGSIWTYWVDRNDMFNTIHWLIQLKDGTPTVFNLHELGDEAPYKFGGIGHMYDHPRGFSAFVGLLAETNLPQHWRLERNGWLKESMTTKIPYALTPGVGDFVLNDGGEPVALMREPVSPIHTGFGYLFLIAERLDPRGDF